MVSIFGILNTGRQGIYAHQSALAVTGNNIANVNTPGYNRQRANLESLAYGGVKLASIQRLQDGFLTTRSRETYARLGASSTLADSLRQMEGALGESTNSGVSVSLGNFFGSLQALSVQPSGTAERESVRSRASQIISTLSGLAQQFQRMREQADAQVVQSVDQINTLTSAIAQLDGQIAAIGDAAAQAQHPEVNQMLDRRDQLLSQLSSIVPVQMTQDSRGMVTIFALGEVLVEGGSQRQLTTVVDPGNGNLHQVAIQDANGATRPLKVNATDGSLGAQVGARDQYGKQMLDKIDRLSAELIRRVNQQHRAGTGLDGVSGRDFFSGLAAAATAALGNSGGAAAGSATITDDSQLTLDDYEIRFTANNRFDIVNTTSGAVVSSNNAYTSGGAIDFAGMRVVISNDTGDPAAGDTFKVNAYAGTAQRMGLSAAVAADTRAIAAGQDSAAGDNRNALALAGLRESLVLGGHPPTQTFEAYFNNARLTLAMASQNAQTDQANDEAMQQQIQGLNDAVSGVSIDEEAMNIIQFQRAFDASSRVIRVTDELLQSLLNMI